MAYASDNRASTFAFGDRISALIAAFSDARAKRKVFNQTLRELNALTNKELADIGLTRSMITTVALDAAEGA